MDSKGGNPVIISYTKTPTDQQSILLSYATP